MQKIFFILLLLCSQSQAQIIQFNDYIYKLPQNSNIISNSINGHHFVSVITSDTLLRLYSNGVAVWKANLQSSNISDTLSASGITGLCRVTVPTTFNTQRIIQLRDIAIIFSTNTYNISYSDDNYSFPLTIKRNSDEVVFCVIYETGAINWVQTPQMSWVGRVGTTRVKSITLP